MDSYALGKLVGQIFVALIVVVVFGKFILKKIR